jgi:AraC family transcriptional regulator of adaptative response/methylated-DNA-[protein]-cysteine methyltransferase
MGTFQYDVIAHAIDYLAAHYDEKTDLDDLAQKYGYEPTHFQKLFRDQVGISPKRLMQYMN